MLPDPQVRLSNCLHFLSKITLIWKPWSFHPIRTELSPALTVKMPEISDHLFEGTMHFIDVIFIYHPKFTWHLKTPRRTQAKCFANDTKLRGHPSPPQVSVLPTAPAWCLRCGQCPQCLMSGEYCRVFATSASVSAVTSHNPFLQVSVSVKTRQCILTFSQF